MNLNKQNYNNYSLLYLHFYEHNVENSVALVIILALVLKEISDRST